MGWGWGIYSVVSTVVGTDCNGMFSAPMIWRSIFCTVCVTLLGGTLLIFVSFGGARRLE